MLILSTPSSLKILNFSSVILSGFASKVNSSSAEKSKLFSKKTKNLPKILAQ